MSDHTCGLRGFDGMRGDVCFGCEEEAGRQWVGQRGANECGVACLAMLTGESYESVLTAFNPLPSQGLSEVQIGHFLNERGWWSRRFWVSEPQPHTSLVLAMVETARGVGHYVVVLPNGRVLDPADASVATLRGRPVYRWTELLPPPRLHPPAAAGADGR